MFHANTTGTYGATSNDSNVHMLQQNLMIQAERITKLEQRLIELEKPRKPLLSPIQALWQRLTNKASK